MALVEADGESTVWSAGPYSDEGEAILAADRERARRALPPSPLPIAAELEHLHAVEFAARRFLNVVGPVWREGTPEGRILADVLGVDPYGGEDRGGDEACARGDMDPLGEARRAFGSLDNMRDRMRDAALRVIRDNEREWRRVSETEGLDLSTWTAAVDLRDSYVADLIRAISEALS